MTRKDAYDSYDYQSYWHSRQYEHESEVIALQAFLTKVKKINSSLEIGAGFGRLTPYYADRSKKITFTDPSQRNLDNAQDFLLEVKKIPNKKIKFQKSKLETLISKFGKNKFDFLMMIRVMHHMDKPNQVFRNLAKLSKKDGYLVFEFANKLNFKALVNNSLKGNFGFINEKTPIDRRSKKNQRAKTLPFLNYHPQMIFKLLKDNGFEVLEVRSVSNIRSPFIKKYTSLQFLLKIEKILQLPLAKIYFGPSLFILAKKRPIE